MEIVPRQPGWHENLRAMSESDPGVPAGANPPGPGWWQASDGHYYPPQQSPGLPPPPGAYPYLPQMHVRATNGLAIASMVLGILWLYWVGSILALVFGYVARAQIKRSHGQQVGGGMAVAGIVLGWIGIGIALVFVIGAIVAAVSYDEINSLPSNGFCNVDRYMEDPDC
ncbi:hypothetical protein GCM10009562_28880 [Nocardioides aquaticus]